LVFEISSRTELLPQRHFPPVSDTFAELGSQMSGAEFWVAVGNTLQGWALGLGIAAALAIPLGIAIGSSRLLYRSVRAVVEFLRPVPSVALVPLAILIYRSHLQQKVFLAAFAAFWQLLIQTIYGVQDTDPVADDTARSFGFSRPQRLVFVTLPGAMPYIATGLRIASSVALILSVTAELVTGAVGLGSSIERAHAGGDVGQMYALIIATGLLGWALNGIFVAVERRILHWHPSQRAVWRSAL
jgi:ABC-type nitrate/sulfonate/bicarbonate transport system permease component